MGLLPKGNTAHLRPRRMMAAMAFVATTLLMPGHARAEYPERTVTVIVPNEAGGPLDIMARIVVKHLSKLTPQKIIIRNIVGGGTAVGDRAAHDAAPDGYTLLVIHQAFLIASSEKTLGFDYSEMTPLARMGGLYPFYVASASAPYKTFPDFLAHMKANPSVDRAGVFLTAHGHLVALEVMQAGGGRLKLINVPGGGAPMVPAILSGQIDVALMSVADATPYAEVGKIVPMVVLGSQRNSRFPDVPTAAELGYPQLDMNVTNYWWMRNEVPAPIRTYWTERLERVMRDPEALAELGRETEDLRFSTGDALKQEITAQYEKFDKLVIENGLKRK